MWKIRFDKKMNNPNTNMLTFMLTSMGMAVSTITMLVVMVYWYVVHVEYLWGSLSFNFQQNQSINKDITPKYMYCRKNEPKIISSDDLFVIKMTSEVMVMN